MLNNPIRYSDPSGHIVIPPPVITGVAGGLVGVVVDLAAQIIPQIGSGEEIQINTAELSAAAVAGVIAGATMGAGTQFAATIGLKGIAETSFTLGVGGAANAAGNQTGTLVESSIESGNPLFSPTNFDLAKDKGFGDYGKIAFDVGSGIVAGGVAKGASSLVKKPTIPKIVTSTWTLENGSSTCVVPAQNRLGNVIKSPNFQKPFIQGVSYQSFIEISDFEEEALLHFSDSLYERNWLNRLNEDEKENP